MSLTQGPLHILLGKQVCGSPLSNLRLPFYFQTAYADQTPVIYNMSLQDNILFGLPYDQERFEGAINNACLAHDLEILQDGIYTGVRGCRLGDVCLAIFVFLTSFLAHSFPSELGEHGVNLSGGQKARIAFARVLYHCDDNTALCAFDDPLSSVDVHVARRLFYRGLLTHLKHKTRLVIMSSHQELAAYADYIIEVGGDILSARHGICVGG